MRSLGLTIVGAISLLCGSASASVGNPPVVDASVSVPSVMDMNSLFVTWGSDVDPAVRELAITLSGGSVLAESSDGLTIQLRADDLNMAKSVLSGFGPVVVTSVQTADEFIRAKFSLSGYSIVSVDLGAARAREVQIPVVLDGREELLVLEQHSLRAPGFKVLVDMGNNNLVEHPLPPVQTYRGVLDGIDGSVVAASLHNGLDAMVRIDGAFPLDYFIQPLAEIFDGAPAGAHVVYSARHVTDQHAMCGGAMLHGDMGAAIRDGEEMPAGGDNARVRKVCQIAFDADFEFYQKNGSSVANTTADIENVMNGVRTTYERDCDVTFTITTIIVRSTSSDPYTSSNPETLLNEFRSHWQGSQGGVVRDIAHLMTGKNIDGGVIGIAWLSAVCTSNGYGLSESRFTTTYNSRLALTAHEIGHNFSANHCDGNGDCHIMCSGLGGCNGIGNPPFFGVAERTGINNYAQGRPCLSNATNNAPTLNVISPDPGQVYNQGSNVSCLGSATDDQDDSTTLSNSITWTSNLQGLLGTGPVVVRSDLVVGNHTITASVTDSGGLTTTVNRSITINGVVTIPATPTNPATIESPAGTAVHSWNDASSNETSFTVQRQQKSGASWINSTLFTGIAANSTSFVNSPGQGVWRYRVRANNSAGSSVYTAFANATPIGPTGQAVSQSSGMVTFSWTDNSLFEENFDVQRQQRVGTTWTNSTVFVQGANATSYVESPGSGQWRYRVRSKVPGKFSAYTGWATITVP